MEIQLEKYKREANFIKDAAKQLAKDFNLTNIALDIDEGAEDLYLELFRKVQPVIKELVSEDYYLFSELLYRIDIDEKKLKRLMRAPGNTDFDELTHLIIERELLKVVTRFLFSNRNLK